MSSHLSKSKLNYTCYVGTAHWSRHDMGFQVLTNRHSKVYSIRRNFKITQHNFEAYQIMSHFYNNTFECTVKLIEALKKIKFIEESADYLSMADK